MSTKLQEETQSEVRQRRKENAALLAEIQTERTVLPNTNGPLKSTGLYSEAVQS